LKLESYFTRIAYEGTTAPNHATLRAIMRAHVAAIPFENIDVQLRRPITGEPDAFFAKLVDGGRGGWCFEQNGLLGWALEALGFDLTRVAGGVMRVAMGDVVLGNHLALIVKLDEPWLADVGFGGSLAEPIPLAPGAHRHAPYDLMLAEAGDGYWRFEESAGGRPFSFDFRADPADMALLAAQQSRLQVDPDSPFVQNLVVQRRIGDTHLTLRGRMFAVMDGGETRETLLGDADQLVATLRDRFGLHVPELAAHWPAICERHRTLFGDG
jgi:N-hydroxyarylamine O-acetyltransferase